MRLIDIIGFVGAGCGILALFQVSTGRWSGQWIRYQITNLLSGILLVYYAWQKHAYATVLLNIIWTGIALYGLERAEQKLARARTKNKK